MESADSISPDDQAFPADQNVVILGSLKARRWIAAIVLAIVAGVIAWGAGETRLLRVDSAETDVMLLGQKIRSATAETTQRAETITAIRTFAFFGALLGLASGLAGQSPKSAIRAALLGLFLGGVSGGVAALAVIPIHSRLLIEPVSEFLTTFVAHAGIWMPIGAAAGLALGLGSNLDARQTRLAIVGGLLGAAIAAILYEVAGALAFPLAETDLPISKSPGSRFLARILLALLVPTTALLLATRPKTKKTTAI